ncbi:MAG: recombinase family protein, partial [Casimicrobiaceae bacterium]
LTVNPDEAEQVRHLFRRYLDLGSVAPLRDELKAQGLRSKRRSTKAGGTYGGCAMTSGALFTILTNPVYRGEIRHRGVCYPGQHDAIVPEELWNAAQELREQTRRAASTLPKAQAKHPLLGLLTDEHDRRYQAVHTTKGHRRYRYYVAKATDADSTNARYPADELEQHVADRIHHFFAGPRNVLDNLLDADDAPKTVKAALQSAEGLKPAKCGAAWSIWRPLMRDVCISPNALTIRLDRQKIRALLGLTPSTDETSTPSTIDLVQPMRLHRTAHALRLVVPSDTGAGEAAQRNDALIRFLSRGRRWYRQITSGEAPSIQAIAKAENVTERYVARVLRGALLAPEMMQRLLEGRQLVTLTVRQLLDPPPIDWSEQRRHFGITAG